jgi:hypothetical protein
MSEAFCGLMARRRAILNNRNAPIRLEVISPYKDSEGNDKRDASDNVITPYKLNERRKAEILQYNNTSSVRGTLTKAQRYKQGIEGKGRTTNKNVENADGSTTTFGISTCLTDLYLPTLSSAAGIPGPSFIIQYRPEVPLYGYVVNAQPIGITNAGPMNAWSFNLGTNIQAINGEWTTMIRIFHNIDNIDSEQVNRDYVFNIDIPIGLYVAGDISGEYLVDQSSNFNFISNIQTRVLDNLGAIITTPTVGHLFNDISMSDISMNYVIDNSSNFTAIQYMGNLPLTATLSIQTLSYYEIQLKFDITTTDIANKYISFSDVSSYVSAAYLNLTDNNIGFKNNITEVKLVTNNGTAYNTPKYDGFTIIGTAQD